MKKVDLAQQEYEDEQKRIRRDKRGMDMVSTMPYMEGSARFRPAPPPSRVLLPELVAPIRRAPPGVVPLLQPRTRPMGDQFETYGGRKKRAPSARNEIVKKVMAERGLSLPQASKYVKEHNLY
jgi:hypothetical protein